MIKLLLCLFLVNAPEINKDSVVAEQSVLNKMQDLPDFTFRASKLTAANIIDSILFYEKQNYLYPKAYSGRITGVLNRGTDTLFYAITDSVYFCRSKKKLAYSPKISKENATEFVHFRLDSFSRKRIMTMTGFPPLKEFRAVVARNKTVAKGVETLFGISRQDSVLIYHILTKSRSEKEGGPSSGFLHLAIDRNGWKLMKIGFYAFDPNEEFLKLLSNSKSCSEALSYLEAGISDPDKRSFKYEVTFKAAANEKLIPDHLIFQDNLKNLAISLFKTTEDKSGSRYTYDITFGDILDEIPESGLAGFDSIDWAYKN